MHLQGKIGQFTKNIHILVLEAFIEPRPNNLVANHKDGIKENNSINNLEWVTYSENLKHAFETGLRHPAGKNTHLVGEETSNAKLKNSEVACIKELLWFDISQTKIAKMFKTTTSTIQNIKVERTRSHIKFVPTDKDRLLYKNMYMR